MIEKTLLWKISKSPDTYSFLFGTMHVRDEVAFKHLEKADKALLYCDMFLSEINLKEAQQKIKPSDYQMQDGLLLTDLLSDKKFKKSRRVIQKAFGIDILPLRSLYPLLLTNKVMESLLSNDRPMSLDAYLWDRAEQLNMTMDGLEAVEDQVNVLKNLDLEIQIKMFKEMVKSVKKYRKQSLKLVSYYRDEDIVALYKASKSGLGALKNKLLFSRNKNMVDKINTLSNEKCFYAVGAAHLAGKKGVLNLLKKEGYKIKAVHSKK